MFDSPIPFTVTRLLVFALLPARFLSAAEEIQITPKIDSVGLFKNGITIVKASFPAPAAGIYCWQEVPSAVHGTFLGKSQLIWVNPGQSACLKITKALSVSAKNGELEEEGQRELLAIGGYSYRRSKVKAKLELHNYRSTEVSLVARLELSGELTDSEADPKKPLLTSDHSWFPDLFLQGYFNV